MGCSLNDAACRHIHDGKFMIKMVVSMSACCTLSLQLGPNTICLNKSIVMKSSKLFFVERSI